MVWWLCGVVVWWCVVVVVWWWSWSCGVCSGCLVWCVLWFMVALWCGRVWWWSCVVVVVCSGGRVVRQVAATCRQVTGDHLR